MEWETKPSYVGARTRDRGIVELLRTRRVFRRPRLVRGLRRMNRFPAPGAGHRPLARPMTASWAGATLEPMG